MSQALAVELFTRPMVATAYEPKPDIGPHAANPRKYREILMPPRGFPVVRRLDPNPLKRRGGHLRNPNKGGFFEREREGAAIG
jgi:hypothetical protein